MFAKLSANLVVVLAEQVHGLAQLVLIDEGTNYDQGTENVPEPESTGVEVIVDAAAGKLVANAVADAMVPYQRNDAAGEQSKYECHQAEIHSSLVVVTAGNLVHISAHFGVEDDGIDAKGDDRQQNELDEAAIGLKLLCGGGVYVLFHNDFLLIVEFSTLPKKL